MQYGEIDCSCGKVARVVMCGVGVYITCPHCGETTSMQSTKEAAEQEWKEMKCKRCEYYGRMADAPESVPKDCMWEMLREEGEGPEPPCEKGRTDET